MINSYSFGTITIDNQKLTKDLIIYPEHINSNWRRKTGHLLTEDDITEILSHNFEILIISTGSRGLMKVNDKVKNLGMELIIKKTAEAVTEYNKIYKDKKVVAALHLTC